MHSEDEIPVEVFNSLIRINNNRIECYKFVLKQTDAEFLKGLYCRLVETSLFCREALIKEVYKLGGIPCEGTWATPEFFSAWLEVHSAIVGDHKRELICATYELEYIVQRSYSGVLKTNRSLLNSVQAAVIHAQQELLREDHQRVNNLRGALTRAA